MKTNTLLFRKEKKLIEKLEKCISAKIILRFVSSSKTPFPTKMHSILHLTPKMQFRLRFGICLEVKQKKNEI